MLDGNAETRNKERREILTDGESTGSGARYPATYGGELRRRGGGDEEEKRKEERRGLSADQVSECVFCQMTCQRREKDDIIEQDAGEEEEDEE